MPILNRKRWRPPMREFKNMVAIAVRELPSGSVTDIFHSVRRRCPEWAVTPHRVRKALAALQTSSAKEGKKSGGARGSADGHARAFPHDVVAHRSPGGRSRNAQWQWRGQVLRVAGYDDGEAVDDESRELPHGHCSVFWLGRNLEQWPNTLTNSNSIRVLDRPWVLGDRVAKADDPLSLGTIVGVKCGLCLSDSRSTTWSPVQDVHAVGGFRTEDWVVCEASRWVGKVEEAVFRVEVELYGGKSDGRASRGRGRRKPAVCVFQVSSEGLQGLEPAHGEDVNPQELSPHFPGQQVRAPARLWRQAEWIHGSLGRISPRRGTSICGIVTCVECCLLAVRWLAGVVRSSKPPDEWISPQSVKMLGMPNSSEGWALGDHVQASLDAHSHAAVVVGSKTVASVQWADGTIEPDVPSLRLCPRPHVSAHDFLPNDLVSRSGEEAAALAPGIAAIVVAIPAVAGQSQESAIQQAIGQAAAFRIEHAGNAQEGYAGGQVDGSNAEADTYGYGEDQEEAAERQEQILPAEPLPAARPIAPLGVVTSVNLQARTAEVQWISGIGAPPSEEKEEVSVFELTEHPDVDIRLGDAVLVSDPEDGRWAGRVCELANDGTAKVKLLDGSTVWNDVRALIIVDDGEGSQTSGEGADAAESDEDGEARAAADDDNAAEWSAHSAQEDDEEWEEAREDPEDDGNLVDAQSAAGNDDAQDSPSEAEPGGDAHKGGSSSSSVAAAPEVLPFDVCDDDVEPVDHYFVQQATLGTRALMIAVRREMVVLRKGLLEGSEGVPAPIIVRTYSSRSDLFRAMVVGPPDTPYAHVPFFFDFALPADYPREPPRAHFHAHYVGNERLNPNLYVDGKVCLSLLGTWSGPSWDPQRSTLLQVLVSLQGLVLVEEPYYNEPGHECDAGTEQGKQSSMLYNEHARLLALRKAVNIAQNPPKGFAEIVSSHFVRFGPKLLAECEASLMEPQASMSSEGFRKVLVKTVLPRLRERWGEAVASSAAAAASPASGSCEPGSSASAAAP